MTQTSIEEKLEQATAVICRQGMVQFPVSDTAKEIIRRAVGSEAPELDLICAFREKPSQTMAQLVETSGFSEETVERLATSLAKKGLIFNQPSSSGLMIYRLLPLMLVGLMEYKFMVPLEGNDAEREMAGLFEKLLTDLRGEVQNNYDAMASLFEASPPIDRTISTGKTESGKPITIIPVEKSVAVSEEFVLPSQSVEEIIDKFDDIAVGRCFCRQRRHLLGDHCHTDAPTENCFTFGKSARHTIAQGFARRVSKEDALEIMDNAAKAGLIHKAFHPGARESSPETSICNCCKDCCDTLRLWREGTLPLINSTYHLSVIDENACTGCGICLEWCPTDAISLEDDAVAVRDESACLGCGVCSRFCPEEAIFLQEGLRKVFIMPPRLR
jgi:ferredoxin